MAVLWQQRRAVRLGSAPVAVSSWPGSSGSGWRIEGLAVKRSPGWRSASRGGLLPVLQTFCQRPDPQKFRWALPLLGAYAGRLLRVLRGHR